MKPATWRLLTVTICAVASASAVLSFASFVGMGGAPPWTGREGFDWLAGGNFNFKVTDVDPGGPGDRAGIHRGDIMDIRANTLLERLWFENRPLTGRPIPLLVHRGAQQVKLVVVPEPYIRVGRWFVNADFLTSPLLTLLFALFAALIAWRRSNVADVRLLALTLAVTAVWNELFGGTPDWATPWAWPYVVADFLGAVALPAAVALSVAYAGCFDRPVSRLRRVCQWVTYAIVAIWAVQGIVGIVGLISLWFDPSSVALSSPIPSYASAVGALVCCALA